MADKYRYAHASCGDLHLGIENLLGLGNHLPLFLGRAILQEFVDVRNDVECNLLGELLRLGLITNENRARLFEQFVHPRFAGTGNRLIGRHDHALDLRSVVERLQRNHHLRGRAVRVGDDITRLVTINRVWVHLRNNQGNIRIHAIERAVVDHGAASSSKFRREDLGCVRADGEQGNIPTRGIEMFDILDFERFASFAIFDDFTCRTRRCNGRDLVCRKLAFRQNIQHFTPDIARGARNYNSITHFDFLVFELAIGTRKKAGSL